MDGVTIAIKSPEVVPAMNKVALGYLEPKKVKKKPMTIIEKPNSSTRSSQNLQTLLKD